MSPIPYKLQPHDTLCFVHVPKTAGTTLISLLDAKFHRQDICPSQLWCHLATAPFLSSNYRLIRGHFTWDDYTQYVASPVFISMFRDPVQRTISEYNFMNDYPDSWKHQQEHVDAVYQFNHQAGVALETRIKLQQRAIATDLDSFVRDPFVQEAMRDPHLRAMATATTDASHPSTEHLLEIATKRLDDLVFFGILEDFQASMALLSYSFGWYPIVQYQKLMIAKTSDYLQGVSSGTLDCLRDMNQGDLVLYDRAVEQFRDRFRQMQTTLEATYGSSDSQTQTAPESWLERHYIDCYTAHQHTKIHQLDLTFDQPISGTGWHLREGNADTDTLFRWTGPATESTLDLPLASGQDLTLRMKVVGGITPEVVNGLTLTVGDRPIPLTKVCHVQDDGLFLVLYQGTIPQSVIESDRPFTRLRFQVPRTQSLQSLDPSNPDYRPVGLAVNQIRLSPRVEPLAEGDRPFLFPLDDVYWRETAQFVRQRWLTSEKIVAPIEFAEYFPGQLTPYLQALKKPMGYNQWVIIHKGQIPTLPQHLFSTIETWTLVFANPVFAVLTARRDWQALDPTNHADAEAYHQAVLARLESAAIAP